jgi:hypothetical protein
MSLLRRRLMWHGCCVQQIRDRLSFLGFLISESGLSFGEDSVRKLWDSCVVVGAAVTVQETEVVLQVRAWLGCASLAR